MSAAALPSLLVIGGTGFVGQHICKAALPYFRVSSLSRSPQPTASNSTWHAQVEWKHADVFDIPKAVLQEADAVVCTIGTLLEGDYKSSPAAFVKQLWDAHTKSPNPLSASGSRPGSVYQRMNHDAALSAYAAFQQAAAEDKQRAFVYLSAEDVFRPLIPAGYIQSKRQAEVDLLHSMRPNEPITPYFLRPSLIYHPQERPISALPATVLGTSASIQSRLPTALRAQSAAQLLTWLTTHPDQPPRRPSTVGPAYDSLVNLLSIPPVHVDTVAEAAVKTALAGLQRDQQAATQVEHVVGVAQMEELLGTGYGASTRRRGDKARPTA